MPIIALSTTSTPWAALIPLVAPHVPECPTPLIREALHRACRKFFSDSHCWREKNLTLLTTVAGQASYLLGAPENGELLQVQTAWDGLTEVEGGTPGDDDEWSPEDSGSTWTLAVSADGTMLEVSPAPTADGVVIKGSMSYTLAPNATGIPTWVFNEHKQGLAAGAAADLVIQAKKPWSNPQAYGGLKGMFEQSVREASNLAGPVRRKAVRSKPW